MGNSNGNIHLYWEYFYSNKFPRLQGGFIWDMIDQGIRKVCPSTGVAYFGYGGDFGDEINDAQFCINGIFSPDREPHPSVHEIKYLQQPIQILAVEQFLNGGDSGNVTIAFAKQDDVSYLSWNSLKFVWELYDVKGEVFVGGKHSFSNQNNTSISVTVKIPSDFLGKATKVWLNFGWYCDDRDRKEWQNTSLISQDQIELRAATKFDNTSRLIANPASPMILKCERSENEVEIWTQNSELDGFKRRAVISSVDGMLVSFVTKRGIEVLMSPFQFNMTRAFTDNDRGGIERIKHLMPRWVAWKISVVEDFISNKSYSYWWLKAGLDPISPPFTKCISLEVTEECEKIIITARNEVLCPSTNILLATQSIEYTFNALGGILVRAKTMLSKRLAKVTSIPRLGFTAKINKTFYNIKYFGRGPFENYCDRKEGSKIMNWSTSPNSMGYTYIVPSENGNRCDCFHASFCDDSSSGFSIVAKNAETPFQFSALLHSQQELHKATHTHELIQREDGTDPIYLCIDSHHMGVGGDVGWSPCVYPEYLLRPRLSEKYYYLTE